MFSIVDPISLPESEEKQIGVLHQLLKKEGKAQLVGKGGEPALELPDAVYSLLLEVISLMQQGKAVSIVPVTQEITTQQASELISVSRPFLVKLLESGTIPFHTAGTHRRVYLKDLMEYKHRRDISRNEALSNMAQELEKAGLYDKVLIP